MSREAAATPRSPRLKWRLPTLAAVFFAALTWGTPTWAQDAAPAANNAPTADSATYDTQPSKELRITLVGADLDGEPLSYIIASLPTAGTLRYGPIDLAPDDLPYSMTSSSITYIAADGDSGERSFTFNTFDGTDPSATAATITINIESPPIATASSFNTEPDTALKFDLPVSDADGDLLEYSITKLPGHGMLQQSSTMLTDSDVPFVTMTGSFTYTPDFAYHGPDTIEFNATDGTSNSGTIVLTIYVNTTPVPDQITATVTPDGYSTITLTSTDADRDAVTYTVASLPSHGTLRLYGMPLAQSSLPALLGTNATDLEYSVDYGYNGTDSFHYRVSDGTSESERAVVVIYVNSPPTASDMNLGLDNDGIATGILTPIDNDGDAVNVRVTQLPAYGELSLNGRAVRDTNSFFTVPATGLSIEYTAEDSSQQSDYFLYVAGDGREESLSARVYINFSATTDPTSDGDGSDSGDDEVLGDQPDISAPACGGPGAIQAMGMTLMLLFVSSRRTRRNN